MIQLDPYVLRLGFGCNNSCKFCFQEKRVPLFRSKKSIRNDLINARLQGFSYVVFEGGEPTISKDILTIIRYAKKIGFKQLDVQTNGRMFAYKEVCLKFIETGVTMFAFSLHAHTDRLHDFLTSAPGSFKESVQGVKNLKRLNQRVANQTVVTKINYRLLPEIVSFLIDLNIDQIHLNYIAPMGVAAKSLDLLVIPMTKVIPYIKKALVVGIKAKKYIGTMGIPCCFLDDYMKYSQEYKRAKAGGRVNDIPFKNKGKVCEGCSYFSVCEGPWSSYVKYFGWKEFRPRLKR